MGKGGGGVLRLKRVEGQTLCSQLLGKENDKGETTCSEAGKFLKRAPLLS